jgi:hexosaminidase
MMQNLKLIPWPSEIEVYESSLRLPKNIEFVNIPEDLAEIFSGDLKALGFSFDSKESALMIEFNENGSLGKEEYSLFFENSTIKIEASCATGLFWSTRTVLQLFSDGPDSGVPFLKIHDKPVYEFRGCMADVARKPHSLTFHRMMIKRLADLKMNFYHIHLSDNEAFAMSSSRYPGLPTEGFALSSEEYKEIVEFAAKNHIEIIPEIDVPGHANILCREIPDLLCKGEKSAKTICAGSEKSYEILEEIICETMDVFPGKYFHFGADEVFFVDGNMESLDVPWARCPVCQELMRKENLDDLKSLYHYFIIRLNEIVKTHGRRSIIWEGFDLNVKPEIPKDILIDQFENYYALPQDLLNAGYELINASWTPLYVTRSGEFMTAPEEMAKWNAEYFGKGKAPKAFKYMLKAEENLDHIKGVCICSWVNEERMEEGLLFGTGKGYPDCGRPGPRAQVAAERGWTGKSTSAQDLIERLGIAWW